MLTISIFSLQRPLVCSAQRHGGRGARVRGGRNQGGGRQPRAGRRGHCTADAGLERLPSPEADKTRVAVPNFYIEIFYCYIFWRARVCRPISANPCVAHL
jgi:hypothetical protein